MGKYHVKPVEVTNRQGIVKYALRIYYLGFIPGAYLDRDLKDTWDLKNIRFCTYNTLEAVEEAYKAYAKPAYVVKPLCFKEKKVEKLIDPGE